MANPYAKTANVTANVTAATAKQYNSVLSELRALMWGFPIDATSDIAITYNGFKIDTITIADSQAKENDITCVRTYTWTGFHVTSIADVYNAGEMNQTVTTTITWTGNQVTAVSRAIT